MANSDPVFALDASRDSLLAAIDDLLDCGVEVLRRALMVPHIFHVLAKVVECFLSLRVKHTNHCIVIIARIIRVHVIAIIAIEG